MHTKSIILVAIIAIAGANEDYYVLDKIDTNALITNLEEMKKFVDCLTDKGPCKKEYEGYKANAGEAVRQACKRCTTEQQLFAWKFLDIVKSNLPEHYTNFRKKFDPENKYFGGFEAVAYKYKPS